MRSRWAPLWIALVITPIALVLAFASAGFGHGNYVLARIVLPFACLLIGTAMTPLVLLAAVIQWPVYGLIVTHANSRKLACGVVLLIHTLAAIWLFTGRRAAFV